MSDKEFLLSEDTNAWLALVAKPSPLLLSHYRLLCVLRDLNSSVSELANLSGMDEARVRQRLKQLVRYGYAEIVETLTDKTQIWGLTDDLRKPEAPTYPTEAVVKARRSRQSGVVVVEAPLVTKSTVRRPREEAISYDIFRPFIAKEPIK